MRTLKVQKLLTTKAQSGIGRVWETIGQSKRAAVAERKAQFARVDGRHQRPVEGRVVQVRIV